MTYTQWKAIYIDKTRTFDEWRAEMDAKYAAATPTKEQLRGREIIEQLAAGKLPSKSSDGKVYENYRHVISELPYKPVSEERYNQLIIPLKKMGVTIHRDEETQRYLEMRGVEADTIGTHDVLFREKVSVSVILEKTHHIRQNRCGMNDDKDFPLRTALNEIDAKKYLLRVAAKYGIPREEIEATKIQLAQYRDELDEYYRKNEDGVE